ncbi:MAG: hypothetical protein AAGE65_13675 [Planctomycetota bacterium]
MIRVRRLPSNLYDAAVSMSGTAGQPLTGAAARPCPLSAIADAYGRLARLRARDLARDHRRHVLASEPRRHA